MPPLDIGRRLDSLRRRPVDDAQHATPLLRLRDNHLHRVGRRAEDIHHLGYFLDPSQHVDRKSVSHRHDKRVPCGNRPRVVRGQVLQRFLVALYPR